MGEAKGRMANVEKSAGITSRMRVLASVIGLLILMRVIAAWKWWPRASEITRHELTPVPPDPRLTYPTPFLNVRPEVKYMGDEACARCHRDLAESYHQHPMGQSLAIVKMRDRSSAMTPKRRIRLSAWVSLMKSNAAAKR